MYTTVKRPDTCRATAPGRLLLSGSVRNPAAPRNARNLFSKAVGQRGLSTHSGHSLNRPFVPDRNVRTPDNPLAMAHRSTYKPRTPWPRPRFQTSLRR